MGCVSKCVTRVVVVYISACSIVRASRRPQKQETTGPLRGRGLWRQGQAVPPGPASTERPATQSPRRAAPLPPHAAAVRARASTREALGTPNAQAGGKRHPRATIIPWWCGAFASRVPPQQPTSVSQEPTIPLAAARPHPHHAAAVSTADRRSCLRRCPPPMLGLLLVPIAHGCPLFALAPRAIHGGSPPTPQAKRRSGRPPPSGA